jgi:hypothetical protein
MMPRAKRSSDRGSQYAAEDYCDELAIQCAWSAPGRWPIEPPHLCPLQGAHFNDGVNFGRAGLVVPVALGR